MTWDNISEFARTLPEIIKRQNKVQSISNAKALGRWSHVFACQNSPTNEMAACHSSESGHIASSAQGRVRSGLNASNGLIDSNMRSSDR